ncbi:hypothetical protein Pelo_19357 [Pelomyxa schiedti]|nr:hypothetical protein Pelo_19357 [Pelomyxa schiedti]
MVCVRLHGNSVVDLLSDCVSHSGRSPVSVEQTDGVTHLRGTVEALLTQPYHVFDVLAKAHSADALQRASGNTAASSSLRSSRGLNIPRSDEIAPSDGDTAVQVILSEIGRGEVASIFLIALNSGGDCLTTAANTASKDIVQGLITLPISIPTTKLTSQLIYHRISEDSVICVLSNISCSKTKLKLSKEILQILSTRCANEPLYGSIAFH